MMGASLICENGSFTLETCREFVYNEALYVELKKKTFKELCLSLKSPNRLVAPFTL